MKSISFIVKGKPQGKARPRFSPHGVYTPKKTKDYEAMIAEAYSEKTKGKCIAYARVEVVARFPIPKYWTKKEKAKAVAGNITPKKPDVDNILKVVLDGLNGIAYEDDSLVRYASCRKVYAPPEDEEGWLYVEVSGE